MDEDEEQMLFIVPKANLLNDCSQGLDHLNRSIFANAIAHKIEECDPPITIGVFGKWGSGKSQLLLQIRDVLKKKQRQSEVSGKKNKASCSLSRAPCTCVLAVLVIMCFIIIAAVWSAKPSMFVHMFNTTSVENQTSSVSTKDFHDYHDHSHVSRYIALGVLICFVLIVALALFCKNFDKSFTSPRLLCYAMFTQLPPKKEEQITPAVELDGLLINKHPGHKVKMRKDTRHIFVNFNTWEYAGSDNLWAAIVTNLSSAIEGEFGAMTSRLFRLITVEDMRKSKTKDDVVKALYINLPRSVDDLDNKTCEENKQQLVDILKSYGVVINCEKHGDQKGNNGFWKVEYSNHDEMDKAFQALSLKGVDVSKESPDENRDSISIGENSANDCCNHSDPNPKRCAMFCHFLEHFFTNPKKRCGIHTMGCWILAGVSFAAILVVIVFLAGDFDLDVYRFGRAVPVIIQVVAWTPPVIAVLYVVGSFLLAICQSHTSRVNKALKGTSGNVVDELGFMSKVKYEVQLMTEIVRCAEFVFNRKYRVVISIDDLDRVDLEKVKSVLDAVNILLSDKNSPFVCLIAVDSRIAVKSVEENMSSSLLQSNVTGHEYLKKIINLPFCLPEISNRAKKQLIYGLITWSDEVTHKSRKNTIDQPSGYTSVAESATELDSQSGSSDVPDSAATPCGEKDLRNGSEFSNAPTSGKPPAGDVLKNTSLRESDPGSSSGSGRRAQNLEESLPHDEFSVACRRFLYKDPTTQSYLDANPRNIKRVFNILSLTLWVLYYHELDMENQKFLKRFTTGNANQATNNNNDDDEVRATSASEPLFKKTKKTSHDLVTWLVLTDQWPYSMSYILQIVEDQSSEMKETDHIYDVYKVLVQPELKVLAKENKDGVLSSDRNLDGLHNYLLNLKKGEATNLTIKQTKLLNQITINLDQSLMTIVQSHRRFVASREDSLAPVKSLLL